MTGGGSRAIQGEARRGAGSGPSPGGAKGQAASGRVVSWLGGRSRKVGSRGGTNQNRQPVRQRESARRVRGCQEGGEGDQRTSTTASAVTRTRVKEGKVESVKA